MSTIECKMNDAQKLAFWQVKKAAQTRRHAVLFLAILGMAAIANPPIVGQLGYLITLAIGVVIAFGKAQAASVDPSSKPPEPKLTLVSEENRIKATGTEGVDALKLIAFFLEQESHKVQRLVFGIGVAFGIGAVPLFRYQDNIPSLISACLSILFVAWAIRFKPQQIRGLAVDASIS